MEVYIRKVEFYKADGSVDIKRNLDAIFTNNARKIIKSSVYGNEYYAAVQELANNNVVVAYLAVARTYREKDTKKHVIRVEWWKETQYIESLCNCPQNIIKLLSAPLNEESARWREYCEKMRIAKQSALAINKLPIGSIIVVDTSLEDKFGNITRSSERYILRDVNWQFNKKPWWECLEPSEDGKVHYLPKRTLGMLARAGRIRVERYGS